MSQAERHPILAECLDTLDAMIEAALGYALEQRSTVLCRVRAYFREAEYLDSDPENILACPRELLAFPTRDPRVFDGVAEDGAIYRYSIKEWDYPGSREEPPDYGAEVLWEALTPRPPLHARVAAIGWREAP